MSIRLIVMIAVNAMLLASAIRMGFDGVMEQEKRRHQMKIEADFRTEQ